MIPWPMPPGCSKMLCHAMARSPPFSTACNSSPSSHAALVTLLLAGAMSQWHGFDPNSPARHYLPAPLISLSDALAGFSFDQALPNGESAIVYPRGTPHNISFRANKFTATFDPKTGL